MRPLKKTSSPAGDQRKTWPEERGLRSVTPARRLNVTPETLSRVMHGREPSLKLAVAIEVETGVPVEAWLE